MLAGCYSKSMLRDSRRIFIRAIARKGLGLSSCTVATARKLQIIRIEHVFGDPVREANPTWALTRGESMYQ